MAFSRNPNAALGSKLFHLLRPYYPNENILFSPSNISDTLQLLDSFTKNLASQLEMLSSFNPNKEHIKTETRQYSEEPTSHSTSEASERAHSMSVLEAMQKPLAKEPLKAKENFPFPTSKQDVGPMKSHLTHVLTSAISQLSTDENLSSNVPPGNKSVPKCEALKIQSQTEIPPDGESFHTQCQSLENQKGLPNRDLASEDVRLPSTTAENTRSTLLQPSNYAAKHVESKNPDGKLGNSSFVFSPDFERREDDKIPGQELPSVEKSVHQNQLRPSHSQEGLSQRKNTGISESHPLSPPALLKEPAAESMLKTQFEEIKCNVDSTETRDSGAEGATTSPFVFPLHDGLAHNNLIQILANAISSEADSDDISSDFLPWSDDLPEREKNENVNQPPVINIFHNQMNAPKPLEELFSNNSDPNPKNTFCNSRAEGAARTTLTDATEMESRSNLKQEKCEVSSRKEGTSSQISQANARPASNNATYTLNPRAPKLISSSCYLPWNKYLQGREKRKALICSFYHLGKNVMENQRLLEIRRYNQYTLVQNPPFASRLTGQSYRSLFRSQSS